MFQKLIFQYKNLPTSVRATAWFACCSFLQRGISMLTTPIFTRLLTPAEYGQFGVFNSWMSILSVFVTMNMFSGMFLQGFVKFEDRRECFASAVQGLCTTLTAAWLAIYLLFRDFWNRLFSLTTVQMLAMLLMIWASAMAGFWSVKQRNGLQYQKLVVCSLLVSFLNPIVGIFLVLHAEDRVTARIFGIAIVELLVYSWMFFSQMRQDHTFFSAGFWRYALKFSIPLIPHYLATAVLSGADRIMIEVMVGWEEAGVYNLAYSVAQIMMIFNTALLQTIEPWLYKWIAIGKTKTIPSIAYPAFTGIALINILLIAFAPEIIAIFAPPTYYDAIWVIPPVAMSVYFMFSYSFFAAFEFYYEKTAYIALSTLGGAILNVILNIVFIQIYGYYAAGYTTLICYIVYAILHYVCMCRLCRIELHIYRLYDLKILLSISCGFMIIGFLLLSTYRYPVIRYTMVTGLLVLLFILRKRIMAEWNQLLRIRKSK